MGSFLGVDGKNWCSKQVMFTSVWKENTYIRGLFLTRFVWILRLVSSVIVHPVFPVSDRDLSNNSIGCLNVDIFRGLASLMRL